MIIIDINDTHEAMEEKLVEIRKGLNNNLFNSDLYYEMGEVYESEQQYNLAYLCYENALQYVEDEEKKKKITSKMTELNDNNFTTLNKVSIVILTYNNLEYTKQCIESIKNNDKLNNNEIIIVDNASSDGTREWLKSQSNIKYLLNDENCGFPKGCNQGIEIAEKKNDIMLLNNDTIVMPNSIFNLRMALYSRDKIGICGCVSNSVSYWQMIDRKFNKVSEYYSFALKNNIPDKSRYDYRIKLIGFAVLINRHALDEIGLLDERFTPGNFEDDDISLRALKCGYRNILCKDSFIFHYGSKSFSKEIGKYSNLLNINMKKFEDKWNIQAMESMKIRFDILASLQEEKEEKFNILEIGCGCGADLFEIKNRYPNSSIYGIENDKNCFEIIKTIENTKMCDLESEDWGYENEFFDYIILNNVIEKTYNPLKVMRNMRRYLKKSGNILAGIYNVLNFRIIRSLINGEWAYTDGGTLNIRNIRYYTCNDIVKLFYNSGYEDCQFAANFIPVAQEEKDFLNKLINLSAMPNAASHMQVFEYCVKARRND